MEIITWGSRQQFAPGPAVISATAVVFSVPGRRENCITRESRVPPMELEKFANCTLILIPEAG